MKRMMIFFELIGLAVFLFIGHYFFFNIYETKAEAVFIKDLGNKKVYEIKFDLLNSLGVKIPFRKAEFTAEVIEGSLYVAKMTDSKIIEVYPEKGAKVVLAIKSEYNIGNEIITINF